MQVRCSGHRTNHDASEFSKDASRSSGYSSSCRKFKDAARGPRKRSPEYLRRKAQTRRRRVRAEAIVALGSKCEECGWAGPPIGYDIHHRSGGGEEQRRQLNYVAYYRYIAQHAPEFALLCALCHRLAHGPET